MRWKLKELQGEYQAATGQRLTYEEITRLTGLGPSTLSQISTGRQSRVDLSTLERLLALFSERLRRTLTTGDILEYIPEQPAAPASPTSTAEAMRQANRAKLLEQARKAQAEARDADK